MDVERSRCLLVVQHEVVKVYNDRYDSDTKGRSKGKDELNEVIYFIFRWQSALVKILI